TVSRDQLPHRAIRDYQGWTLRESLNPPNPPRLEAVHADGRQSVPIAIDPSLERHWWSWTFLPPGPAHLRPTVAVGTEAGVAVFAAEPGRRPRVFAGHSAPVAALRRPPTADGWPAARWTRPSCSIPWRAATSARVWVPPSGSDPTAFGRSPPSNA